MSSELKIYVCFVRNTYADSRLVPTPDVLPLARARMPVYRARDAQHTTVQGHGRGYIQVPKPRPRD
jgi:hypothetical protein